MQKKGGQKLTRLIDADALKDKFQNLAYDDWNQGVSTTWANAYSECADMVEEMPTIEPERKNCETCRYNALQWDEEPCDGCTGDHWKPIIERKKGELI